MSQKKDKTPAKLKTSKKNVPIQYKSKSLFFSSRMRNKTIGSSGYLRGILNPSKFSYDSVTSYEADEILTTPKKKKTFRRRKRSNSESNTPSSPSLSPQFSRKREKKSQTPNNKKKREDFNFVTLKKKKNVSGKIDIFPKEKASKEENLQNVDVKMEVEVDDSNDEEGISKEESKDNAEEVMKKKVELQKKKEKDRMSVLNKLLETWITTKTIKLSRIKPKLKEFPSEILSSKELARSVNVIIVSHNLLSKFPLEFLEFSSLVTICADHNIIETIPNNICMFQNLKFLDLSYNKIKFLPRKLFDIRNLRFLNLNNNQISVIPGEMIYRNGKKSALAESIVHLEIGNNYLKEIPKEIGEMINLKKLVLNDNEIGEIPNEIGDLLYLEELFIERTKVYNLPTNLLKTKDDNNEINVKNLLLRYNRFKEFPDFSMMKKLQGVFLGGNQLNIEGNNKWLSCSSNIYITICDLSSNEIEIFPKSLKELSGVLVDLDLSFNRIKVIPEYIIQFQKLKKLNMKKNKVEKLSKHFVLSSLEFLYFEYNNISDIHEDVLLKCFNLYRVDFSYNKIGTIPKTISNLKDLNYINFSHNEIEKLPEQVVGCEKLVYLDLSFNKIGSVPYEINKFKTLRSLQLNSNDIKEPPHRISKIVTLLYCNLRDNPFLKSFKRKKKKRSIGISEGDALMNDEEFSKVIVEYLQSRTLEDILELSSKPNVECKIQ